MGIVLISKLIEFLLEKFATKTYFGVLGFIIASVAAIPISVYHEIGAVPFSIMQSIMGILLLIVGYVIGVKLGGTEE